jgi:predicted ester cyclase
MTIDANEALIRRLNECLQEFWRTGNADILDEVLAPEFVHHAPGIPPDRAGLKQMLPLFRAAFPDLQITIDDLIVEGDKVCDRVTVRGTHRGALMGIPPTGKPITMTEIHLTRIAGGKIVERWGEWDQLGLLQQIGAIPAPG